MSRPLVSVHVVTYNQREFIRETIESIVTQDYAPLEVVVADDGSTDGTAELAREAERRYSGRVIALTGGPRRGISGNSNRCLALCRGQYVAFVAGDDLMLPGKLRAQVEWLEADPDRVLCAHDVEHFDSDTGRRLRLHSSVTRLRSGSGVGQFLRSGYFSATSSLMVRAAAMPARGFDERIGVHSDWKFAAECLVAGGAFGYTAGILGRYRRHARNATDCFCHLAWQERHTALALLEAEYPHLLPVWQRARARAYRQRAVRLVQHGLGREARADMRRAVAHSPAALASKLALWWGISFVPARALPAWIRAGAGLDMHGGRRLEDIPSEPRPS